MTPYEKGRAFEYSTIKALKAKGFTCMRSYASRTPADIWAVMGGRAYFIQAALILQAYPTILAIIFYRLYFYKWNYNFI